MIEGIVGIFVILFLILAVPYIKDAWTKYNEPTEIKLDRPIVSYDPVIYTEPSAMPPANPVLGQIWRNTHDKKVYTWNGKVWLQVGPLREGDIWFW